MSRRSRNNRRPTTTGKNKPLRQLSVRWCSQHPLTASQLQRKREEFWDTAPAFDGRVEIWNALKAAAQFLERDDREMAQAIIDGADIILPTGTLRDCYDRLGARYQLPLYVLIEPTNLIPEELECPITDPVLEAHHTRFPDTTVNFSCDSIPEYTAPIPIVGTPTAANQSACPVDRSPESYRNDLSGCCSLARCCRIRRTGNLPPAAFHRPASFLRGSHGGRSTSKRRLEEGSWMDSRKYTTDSAHVRLSTGEDYFLEFNNANVTVLEAKHLLEVQSHCPANRQRWFTCGRPLPDHARLRDCRIPEGFVIQVIVHSPCQTEPQWGGPASAHISLSSASLEICTNSLSTARLEV